MSVIFYAGFRAETVSAKLSEIYRHLGDVRRVANFGEGDIEQILSDPKMIRNRRKVKACAQNARCFLKVVEEHGSFHSFVASFEPEVSFEGLFLLKEDIESRFSGIGEITTYHVLTDLGLPVLKPDRVIMRIFRRLGLVQNSRDLLRAVIHGRRFGACQPV